MIVQHKSTYFKIKDIAFYALSELRTTVYSNKKVPYCEMSNTYLFRQMTIAAKRVHFVFLNNNKFIHYAKRTINRKEDRALALVKWIKNYENLFTAECIICQMKLYGLDLIDHSNFNEIRSKFSFWILIIQWSTDLPIDIDNLLDVLLEVRFFAFLLFAILILALLSTFRAVRESTCWGHNAIQKYTGKFQSSICV